MNGGPGYAVFLFDQAIEVLGDAIKPYLTEGPAGAYLRCRSVDTGGALIECTISARGSDGRSNELEVMFPSNMVRLIASARIEESFGFGPHALASEPLLPPVGPTGSPANAPSEAVPTSAHIDDASRAKDSRLPPEG